jgi:hypothetical protein
MQEILMSHKGSEDEENEGCVPNDSAVWAPRFWADEKVGDIF